MEPIKNVLFKNGYTITNNDMSYVPTSSKEIKNASMAVKLMILKTHTSTVYNRTKQAHNVNSL